MLAGLPPASRRCPPGKTPSERLGNAAWRLLSLARSKAGWGTADVAERGRGGRGCRKLGAHSSPWGRQTGPRPRLQRSSAQKCPESTGVCVWPCVPPRPAVLCVPGSHLVRSVEGLLEQALRPHMCPWPHPAQSVLKWGPPPTPQAAGRRAQTPRAPAPSVRPRGPHGRQRDCCGGLQTPRVHGGHSLC